MALLLKESRIEGLLFGLLLVAGLLKHQLSLALHFPILPLDEVFVFLISA